MFQFDFVFPIVNHISVEKKVIQQSDLFFSCCLTFVPEGRKSWSLLLSYLVPYLSLLAKYIIVLIYHIIQKLSMAWTHVMFTPILCFVRMLHKSCVYEMCAEIINIDLQTTKFILFLQKNIQTYLGLLLEFVQIYNYFNRNFSGLIWLINEK